MRRRNFLTSIFVLFCSVGCSIHPLPEDVTSVSTYDIVRQIRCETRQAVIDSALIYLTKSKTVDPRSSEIGRRFLAKQEPIEKLDPNLFTGHVRKVMALFWKTGVAYNYSLQMTEVNDADAEIGFLRVVTGKQFDLGLKTGLDRQRQNTRTFTVTDNFRELVQKLSPKYCARQLVHANYIYPITGKIGVDGMVHAFVYLSLFGNLGESADNPKGPPTLVDALEFQTKIYGSAAPKVTFSPVGDGFDLADASLTAAVSRTDVHTVVVGLALEGVTDQEIGGVRGELVGRLLTATGKGAELTAANAVDQFLAQKAFSPTIVVNQ